MLATSQELARLVAVDDVTLQRVAAETFGWSAIHPFGFNSGIVYENNPNHEVYDGPFISFGTLCGYYPGRTGLTLIPKYPESLDAAHELWESLSAGQRLDFAEILGSLCPDVIGATARERTLAYVLVKGTPAMRDANGVPRRLPSPDDRRDGQ